MPKHPSGRSERTVPGGQRKAGKGRKPFTAPPEPSEANLSRRIMGDQQFELRRPATVEIADLTGKLRAVAVPFGWDTSRKHITFSPSKQERA